MERCRNWPKSTSWMNDLNISIEKEATILFVKEFQMGQTLLENKCILYLDLDFTSFNFRQFPLVLCMFESNSKKSENIKSTLQCTILKHKTRSAHNLLNSSDGKLHKINLLQYGSFCRPHHLPWTYAELIQYGLYQII